jgi:hypothetical protein
MPALPREPLRPTYLSAREPDGTLKWYVAITQPFTANHACLTGYGPRPDPDGTFHPVTPTGAAAKVREKLDVKGYLPAARADIPAVAQQRLLAQLREMTGLPNPQFLDDGRIALHGRAPRRRQGRNAVWL